MDSIVRDVCLRVTRIAPHSGTGIGYNAPTMCELRLLALSLLTACGFRGTSTAQQHDDAFVAPDVAEHDSLPPLPDAPSGFVCMGPADSFRFCLATSPTTPFDIATDLVYDTNTCVGGLVEPQAGGDDVCLIAATSSQISARLTAVGARPLVIFATGDIAITSTGAIDVASHRVPLVAGAGADPSACSAGTPGGSDGTNGGGGAGGSFVGKGGDGGAGGGGGAGHGNAANAASTPTVLRGGCRGTQGGGSAGAPGGGGGAVYLLTRQTISIAGSINASGAAGGGAIASKQGGSGGGAGGMIALFATAITGQGALYANGGGGGAGGSANSPGAAGGEATDATSTPKGGTGPGGAGGDGAYDVNAGRNGVGNGKGGGGGGGGAGVIRILSGR